MERVIRASRPWSGTPTIGSKERGPKLDKSIFNDWRLRYLDCPFTTQPPACRTYSKRALKECPLDER